MKKRGNKSLTLYSNLSKRRKSDRDHKARRKAEYLASLPKHPLKRLLYRMHPRRFFKYWFSREGLFMALKIGAIGLGIILLLIGTLFVYYRRELNAIRPEEISKRVQTTVTKYYDRNGVMLWQDKGDGNYKLVVKSEDIAQDMKDATVAIEDKDFYKHGGFSLTGIVRAGVSNLMNESGSTQGGSTLTQQLIKQVFFSDEAGNRGLGGVPRKIKEVILSIQVEGMYNKDQILTMYLNESPYGGRRNGVESAAQTYFGKSAKDLTLAESALLAAIPQQPGVYNPYNTEGHKSLLARKDTVLTYMAEQGYITKEEAAAAKKVAVLDTVKLESEQFKNVKAPHFIQMVKKQLQEKLGTKTVGNGGLTVKTTLDARAQDILDAKMDAMFASTLPTRLRFDNGSATMIDVQTGQILAMRGSRGFDYSTFGENNYATAFIQPGSTIKPLVYASLFKGNYSPGSIIADSPIPQSIYKTDTGQSVANFDNSFKGSIPIRSSLAMSRNIPAIKAMFIAGIDKTVGTMHDLGDVSYCTNGKESVVGLSAALGSCGAKQIEHVNAFATFARMGVYKPVSAILEVRNTQGQVIDQWKDSSKTAVDAQVAYEISDILSDNAARAPAVGSNLQGMVIGDGVKVAGKTGTSNDGATGLPKDLWFLNYSPKVALGIWVGNHDNTTPLASNAYSTLLGPTAGQVMHDVHINIFEKDGTWKRNDWFTVPAGLQKLNINGRSDWYPSWYNKAAATVGEKIVFDKVSKKKATDCTPEAAKIEVILQAATDPVTKKKSYILTDGYDPDATDDVHKCDDLKPFINSIDVSKSGSAYKITVSVTQGTHSLQTLDVKVGDTSAGSQTINGSGSYTFSYTPSGGDGTRTITASLTDSALYTASPLTKTYTFD